jgi:hypothetical protein
VGQLRWTLRQVEEGVESAATDVFEECELVTDIREGIVPFEVVVSGARHFVLVE